MNFIEAVQAMKEGKKIKRKFWDKTEYIYQEDYFIKNIDGEVESGNLWDTNHFEATDWEIVDENPNKITLDKISKWREEFLKTGLKATDIIFKYPENDELIIGDKRYKCTKGSLHSVGTIMGMEIWVDEGIEGSNAYIIDKNTIVPIKKVEEDKDWNLKDQEGLNHFDSFFHKRDVKKCRDLILEDVNKDDYNLYLKQFCSQPRNCLPANYETWCKLKIKKRFGDL